MGNIKDRELAALIVCSGDPLRLAVHDRVLALNNGPDLAQDRGKFRPWIQLRRRLILRFPFRDFFAVRFRTHVPSFFDRVPTCSERFRLVPFGVRHSQVYSFRVWNIRSHRPNLLGMLYLLLSLDRDDVFTDALGVRRGVQNFLWRIGEDLDPMIDIAGVTVRIATDPYL
jgi:hypothetical protein